MLRIGLLDTTIQGAPGSMARYREQLADALRHYCGDRVTTETLWLGCDQKTLNRTKPRFRMWRHHLHVWRAARNIDVSQFDILHLLDGSFGYVTDLVSRMPVVVTVHDVIPRLQMDGVFPHAPPVGRAARWMIHRSLAAIKAARHLCVDSQSTADDLTKYQCHPLGGMTVVPLAIDPTLFSRPPDASPVNGLPAEECEYLFHVGNNGFYKNRSGAIEVLRRIAAHVDLHLVMAGPPANEPIRELVDKYRLQDRVHFVIDPSQDTLAELYRRAAAFLFPSVYEGFGWPPLEAMSVGCPVVSSDAGSLREVVGDAGLLAATGDYDAMARGCERLVIDTDFRSQMITMGHARVQQFGTRRLAESMADVYAMSTRPMKVERDEC